MVASPARRRRHVVPWAGGGSHPPCGSYGAIHVWPAARPRPMKSLLASSVRSVTSRFGRLQLLHRERGSRLPRGSDAPQRPPHRRTRLPPLPTDRPSEPPRAHPRTFAGTAAEPQMNRTRRPNRNSAIGLRLGHFPQRWLPPTTTRPPPKRRRSSPSTQSSRSRTATP